MKIDREKISRVVLGDLKRSNDFFREKIEPQLLERRAVYLSQKDYYSKKFPSCRRRATTVVLTSTPMCSGQSHIFCRVFSARRR